MNARSRRLAALAAALSLAGLATACSALVDWDSIHEDVVAEGGAVVPADAAAEPAYASLVRASGPLAYYRFEEPAGDAVANVMGAGFPGTLRGGFTRGNGAVGRGVVLDGKDGRLDLGDSFAFVEDASRSWTVELVVEVDRIDADYTRIFSREAAASSGTTGIVLFSHTDVAGFQRVPGEGKKAMGTFTSAPLATGRFLHLAATCAPDLCRLYVDGARVGGLGNAAGDSAPADRARAFVVGASSLGGNALKGTIDEVAVYDVALSGETVAAHRRALP